MCIFGECLLCCRYYLTVLRVRTLRNILGPRLGPRSRGVFVTLDVARPKDVVATQGLPGAGGLQLGAGALMPMQMMQSVQRAQKIFVRPPRATRHDSSALCVRACHLERRAVHL